jgi:hypothetical protein
MKTVFDFKLIPCPRCEGQGWLFPWEVKFNRATILSCEECDAMWLASSVISQDNFVDLSTYITNNYPAGYFQGKHNVYDEIKELQYETILENEQHFGCFPKEAHDFFVYYSNAFFICECKLDKVSFENYLIKCNLSPINDIKLLPIKCPTRIIRYNFRYYCDYDHTHKAPPHNTVKNISQFSRILTREQTQIVYRKFGTRLIHIVYDENEGKLYWYQLQGKKGNYFFDKAAVLHNIFYPENNI